MRVLDALVGLAQDPATQAVPLSSLLIPLVALVLAALIAAGGTIVVARIQARASRPAPGVPVLVTVDKGWLDDLIVSERMLSAIVAKRLPHVDPLTGLDR